MKTIHVVAGCDNGFVQQLTVMLLSLFQSSRDGKVRAYIIVPPAFDSEDRVRADLGNIAPSVSFIRMQTDIGITPVDHSITDATYYRLFLGDLLPQACKLVVYLDCDMLICGDLRPLWNTDLNGAVVGAVSDCGFEAWDRLGLDPAAGSFNAGMMLIDLESWRRKNIGSRALAFVREHPERLTYDDQCALNWTLQGLWAPLDPIWNLQVLSLGSMGPAGFRYNHDAAGRASTAQIVHFNRPERPWDYMCEHPSKPAYEHIRANTSWRAFRASDRYPHNMIIKGLRRYAPPLLPFYRAVRRFV